MRKFMRTRQREVASVPLANGHSHKTNGHANGSAGEQRPIASRREDHSTLSSRYWSGSEWSGGGFEGEGEEGEVEGAPWEDPEFPPNWRSIGDRRAAAGVVWVRPHELCARPTFLGCGGAEEPDSELFAQRWRVELGPLGDPHLCCAAGALALTPRLLARVAPPQQPHPARRYRFRFWVWGSWREVQVDDRLPCKGGRALGARSGAPGDYALPLLEKAYAKLYGSYRALRSGNVARALLDLSGGVVQALPLRRTPRALLARVLHAAVPRSTLLVASAARAGNGLAARRPYAVTGLARLRGGEVGEGETLLRLRAVCVAPPSPRPLPSADCELLASRAPAPGDFWMSLKEFCAAFSHLELVHVGPDDWMAEPALRGKRPWRAVLARRRWRTGYNAGGPPGGVHSHANPQFHVSVPRACRLVVSVAQQYALKGDSLRAVGFSVLAQGRVLDVTAAVRAREVVTFFSLPAGRYLVVPHTRRAHTDRAFLLRILTDERADVWEANEDNAVLRGVSAEMEEAQRAMPEAKAKALARLVGERDPEAEVDATRLRSALAKGGARCSPELCRALVALRDSSLRGCMRASELPALLTLLAQWRQAYGMEGASSYRTRALLVAGGVCASNKVVECVVARWARARRLSRDAFLVALARLHLAHERYRCLDAKLKSNPLSLEEMILMTIYS